ncbi:MAG: DUF2281 domain-containing protein [Verrucomicrobia bacterium]|nr:DUF2281 domain-containing protein [Verrucomicrobiota bacterium]MCH8511351.1 DUF2281 domain-containing protein [Kiritimatiellia bacterium]
MNKIDAVWGDMEGKIRMSEDFDEPLEDFSEYMGITGIPPSGSIRPSDDRPSA